VSVLFSLHVGVLEKRKNLPRLVEAFARFSTWIEHPYHLILVGPVGPKRDMDDSASIRATIERLGLEKSVVLVGHVPDHDLPAFYQGATFFVFPSLREGFGIPVLEAFNNDLPVVAADSTAIPEVAGDAALLFEPTDVEAMAQAMLRVATDNDLRASLVRRGRERTRLFSWDRTASRLIDLFEQILNQETTSSKNHRIAGSWCEESD
jgi:glycosyltransferase involved in cell wall biosynthesis